VLQPACQLRRAPACAAAAGLSRLFDSRGVHRIYDMRVTDDGWEIARDAPEFSQRLTVTFEDDDNTMAGRSKISRDDETWQDDLQITYRRSQ
jgi:hypothetical protein